MSDRHCLALRQGTCDWELTQADYARESRGINRAKDLMGFCHFISVRQSGSRRSRWARCCSLLVSTSRTVRLDGSAGQIFFIQHPSFPLTIATRITRIATSAANLFLILYSFSFHTHCRCLFSMSQRPSLPPLSFVPRVSFNLSQLVGENLCK